MATGENKPDQEPKPVSDDSGAVKVTYEVEDDSKPSVLQKIKEGGEKLARASTPKHETLPNPSPEVAYQLAAAADTPQQTKLASGLNIRQSAGGSQESAASQREKVSRGEELGTGYEPDSDSSGRA